MPKTKLVSKIKIVSAVALVIGVAGGISTASANSSSYSPAAETVYTDSMNSRSASRVEDSYGRKRSDHRHRHNSRRGHYGKRYNSDYSNNGYQCRKVEKEGYWYGKEALIGGTMCYDSYGQSYIVSGSRYLVRYNGYN